MTIHSAQSPEGSNMIVSKGDEEQNPEQIIRAQEGMISDHYGHIQTNDCKENAVTGKARVECTLQHKLVKQSATSHDFIVDNSSDDDNDSYYTARNSPEREVYELEEVKDFIKIESGQIVTPTSFEAEYEKLQKQLKRNNVIEKGFAEELHKYEQIKENLELQTLELKVRQSIACNRKPMMNASADIEPPAANKSRSPTRRSKKGKQKAKLTKPSNDNATLSNQAIKRSYTSDTESTLNVRPDVLPDVDPVTSNQLTGKTAERKKIIKSEATAERGKIIKSEATDERKERINSEALISEEEKALIKPDCPPYCRLKVLNSKELTKETVRTINNYLNNNALSLKEMKLILLNLKISSTGQVRQIKHAKRAKLTINQELFVAELIKRSLNFMEDYMTSKESQYKKMMEKREIIRRSRKHRLLPESYYGDITTLNFQARDLSHYELYKIIMHFSSIIDKKIQTKAQRYLLKSGMAPDHIILRTCDPEDSEDIDATNIPNSSHLSSEPTQSSFEPAHSLFEPARSSFKPVHSSFEPSRSTLEPAHSSFEPSRSTLEPAHSSFEPSRSTLEPAHSSFEPSRSTLEPAHSSYKPAHPSFDPAHPCFEASYPSFGLALPSFECAHSSSESILPNKSMDSTEDVCIKTEPVEYPTTEF